MKLSLYCITREHSVVYVKFIFQDDAGKSAFLRAAEQGRIDVLRYLFSLADLDPAEADPRGRNVLHLAADGPSSTEVVSFLLAELPKRFPDGDDGVKRLLAARDRYIGSELCMLIRGKDHGRDSWHYVEVVRSVVDAFMQKTRAGTIDVARFGTVLQSGWGQDPDEASAREIEQRFDTRRMVAAAAQSGSELDDSTPLHIATFKVRITVCSTTWLH